MAVKVMIPTPLRPFAGRQVAIDVEGHTVGEALDALTSRYGDLRRHLYADGGRLCRCNLRSGAVKVLLDDPKGGVRDPQVHYDAGKIVFAHRPAGTDYFHLFEINMDGSGLRQLTSGDFDDAEMVLALSLDGKLLWKSPNGAAWLGAIRGFLERMAAGLETVGFVLLPVHPVADHVFHLTPFGIRITMP